MYKEIKIFLLLIMLISVTLSAGCVTYKYSQSEDKETRYIKFNEFGAEDYRMSYVSKENSMIKVKMDHWKAFEWKSQLKNEVEMNPGNVLVFDNLDNDEEVIIVYLALYPDGQALMEKVENIDEAKTTVEEKLSIEKDKIKVINRKTGD
ncbi:MAG: hypothetical protein KAI57_01310 [Candidatus Pacebacteria bacterium]|nr:hypothetical protein [Candidatus Paceibacterota bacterium]